jgi:hypothetical protein
MMLDDQPPRYRSRTHELGPFWRAMDTYRHNRWNAELRAAEWADLAPLTVGALVRAGFTCRRQVEACPDWLLKTIPSLGPVGLKALRRIMPYRRDIYRHGACPGEEVERRQWREWLEPDPEDAARLDALIRRARLAMAVEDRLYGPAQPMEAP